MHKYKEDRDNKKSVWYFFFDFDVTLIETSWILFLRFSSLTLWFFWKRNIAKRMLLMLSYGFPFNVIILDFACCHFLFTSIRRLFDVTSFYFVCRLFFWLITFSMNVWDIWRSNGISSNSLDIELFSFSVSRTTWIIRSTIEENRRRKEEKKTEQKADELHQLFSLTLKWKITILLINIIDM